MPRLGPISRRDLVSSLRQLGFVGPMPGTRHQIRVKGTLKLRIPNPHRGDVSQALLERILKQAGVSRQEWEAL
jgi:hypothetical protein